MTLMVSDFNRAVTFYTDTLGLTLKARYGVLSDDQNCRSMTIRLAA